MIGGHVVINDKRYGDLDKVKYMKKRPQVELPNGSRTHDDSSIAQWLERPTGVLEGHECDTQQLSLA